MHPPGIHWIPKQHGWSHVCMVCHDFMVDFVRLKAYGKAFRIPVSTGTIRPGKVPCVRQDKPSSGR